MQTRSKDSCSVKRNSTNSTSYSIFPTPTSLESIGTPKTNAIITLPPSIVKEEYSYVVERRVGGEKRRRVGSRGRRSFVTEGMTKVRGEALKDSFSAASQNYFRQKRSSGLLPSEDDYENIRFLSKECIKRLTESNRLGSLVTRNRRLDRLINQTKTSYGQFEHLNGVSAATINELNESLGSIFVPLVRKFNASIDTAFLAYGILWRYSHVSVPRTSSIRDFLYIASMIIAFKYNEEEDPTIAEFSAFVSSWRRNCNNWKNISNPMIPAILRMEQRIMVALKWRLGDISTPQILIQSVFDCIMGEQADPCAKYSLCKRTMGFLVESVLGEEGCLRGKSLIDCVSYSISNILSHYSGRLLEDIDRLVNCSLLKKYVNIFHKERV